MLDIVAKLNGKFNADNIMLSRAKNGVAAQLATDD